MNCHWCGNELAGDRKPWSIYCRKPLPCAGRAYRDRNQVENGEPYSTRWYREFTLEHGETYHGVSIEETSMKGLPIVCRGCGEEKRKEEMVVSKQLKCGHTRECRPCKRIRDKESRALRKAEKDQQPEELWI